MTKLIPSLLLAHMFYRTSFKKDGEWLDGYEAVVHESALGLQGLLREGQCLADDTFHNASWYNRLGEKVGWGDLSVRNLQEIPGLLPPGEVFIVCSEMASFWDLPKDCDPMNPGIDFLVEKALLVVTPLGFYVLPSYNYSDNEWEAGSEIFVRGSKLLPAHRESRDWLRKLLDVANRTEINFKERFVICPVEAPTLVEELLPNPWGIGENWCNSSGQELPDGRWKLGFS